MNTPRWRLVTTSIAALCVICAGCANLGPEPPGAAAASERLERGEELLDAADGSGVTVATVVDDGANELFSTCFSVTTEAVSVAPERSFVNVGTWVADLKTCTVGESFVVDGDFVYVQTDELVPGHHAFLHSWARISPEVRESVVGSSAAPSVRYSSLVDTATYLDDDGEGPMSISVDVEALVEAGLFDADVDTDGYETAMLTFSFDADGALSGVVSTMTDEGLTVTVLQTYERLNEDQAIEVPEDLYRNPESASITTLDDFERFVGLSG